MNTRSNKMKLLGMSIGLSVLAHLLILFSMGRFGSYNFTAPIEWSRVVMVDLKKTVEVPAQPDENYDKKKKLAEKASVKQKINPAESTEHKDIINTPPIAPERSQLKDNPVQPPQNISNNGVIQKHAIDQPADSKHIEQRPDKSIPVITAPLRSATEFMTAKSEKLTYLLSMLGVPVGSSELEAENKNGEIHITLRTKSNEAFNGIYPVDNFTETRHINGNFIINKSKLHEGTIRRDIAYTIFLREKSVFWVDRIKNKYSRESVPTSDVLDILSSFYYLRKRTLKIGTIEILHVYDGNTFADVPIEVLRREEIRLRNFKKVDTLLLRRVLKEGVDGIRTGELLVWLTNDENRVPVKVETNNAIGRITAELESAEIMNIMPNLK